MTADTPVIDRYIGIWNETDPARRRDLIVRTLADDCTYVDPLVVADGADAIEATVADVQKRYPGFTFRLGGSVDAHHNLARFTWEMVPAASQEAIVVGFDVAVFAPDGRLQQVHGFLNKVPTA